jgi:FkbM family methyltransferase
MTIISQIKWRIGRSLYMSARGEQRNGTIHNNGERSLIRYVLDHVPRNECLVALDIGANRGEYTSALLAEAGSERLAVDQLKIHAFEPVPSTADIFYLNLAEVPGHECVTLHRLAMSDNIGKAQIAIYDIGAGTNTMHYTREGRTVQSIIEVPLTTLTQFAAAQSITHIHLAKVDTEGNDSAVLRGATPLLAAGAIDILQFEYNHRWVYSRSFLKDVFEMIEGLPYQLARIDETRLTVFADWHPELERFFQSNYVLVHSRAKGWFPTHYAKFDSTNTHR